MDSKNSLIYNLFPEHLLENEDYRSFIDILNSEYDYIINLIDKLPELSQVMNVPEKFIQYLSYMSKYRVLDSEDISIQREILSRIFDAYAERGSERSLLKSASRSNDPNWYMGDLTYYNGPLKEDPVSITYPQYELFTYNKSEYSRSDRYQDGSYWSDGVIIFNMTGMTKATKDAIERTIPAGRKYYFKNTIWIVSDDVTNDLSSLVYKYKIFYDQTIFYYLRITTNFLGMYLSSKTPWSTTGKWSGNFLVQDNQVVEPTSLLSYLPIQRELEYYSSKYNYIKLFKHINESVYDEVNIHNLYNESTNRLVKFIPKFKFYDTRSKLYTHVKYATKSNSDIFDIHTRPDYHSNVMLVSSSTNSTPSSSLDDYKIIDLLPDYSNAMHEIEWSNSDTEIEVKKSWYGSAKWSVDFRWNTNLPRLKNLSGQYTGIKDFDAKIYNILPSDKLYTVSNILNKKISSTRDPFRTSVYSDIKIYKQRITTITDSTNSKVYNLLKNTLELNDSNAWMFLPKWSSRKNYDYNSEMIIDSLGSTVINDDNVVISSLVNTRKYYGLGPVDSIEVEKGRTYTYSVSYKYESDIRPKSLICYILPQGSTAKLNIYHARYIEPDSSSSSKFVRYYVTFTVTSSGVVAPRLETVLEGTLVRVALPCLVEGTSSNWVPHKDDTFDILKSNIIDSNIIYNKDLAVIDSNEEDLNEQ